MYSGNFENHEIKGKKTTTKIFLPSLVEQKLIHLLDSRIFMMTYLKIKKKIIG